MIQEQPPVRRGLLAALLILVGIGMASTQAAESVDDLTQRLIELRGEIQQLNSDLELKREQHKARMQSLERQRGEVEARAKREELKLAKLEQALQDNLRKAQAAGAAAGDLAPVLMEAIAAVRGRIQSGLPFKVNERLAVLDELAAKINDGSLSPHKASNQLWAFFEDELRLTRENGIYRQPVRLGDQEVLADVARLGMVMLYFQTSDGRVGAALADGRSWRFETYYDRTDKEQVVNLFDQLRKQIRTGFFVVPNVLPAMESVQ